MSPLKKKPAQIRPEYVGIDPVHRMTYEPGEITQCDLWFPEPKVPVAPGQERILPVLVMTFGFSRFMTAVTIPSRQGGDILSGMWELVSGIGRVTKTLVWDREAVLRHCDRRDRAGDRAGRGVRRYPGPPIQGQGRAEQPVPGDLVPARPAVRLARGHSGGAFEVWDGPVPADRLFHTYRTRLRLTRKRGVATLGLTETVEILEQAGDQALRIGMTDPGSSRERIIAYYSIQNAADRGSRRQTDAWTNEEGAPRARSKYRGWVSA